MKQHSRLAVLIGAFTLLVVSGLHFIPIDHFNGHAECGDVTSYRLILSQRDDYEEAKKYFEVVNLGLDLPTCNNTMQKSRETDQHKLYVL